MSGLGRYMNRYTNHGARRAQIGQWYLRRDKGEIFQVTAYDDRSRTVEIQTCDGDLDEIEMETWRVTPLYLVEPPEDGSGPADEVEDGEPGDSTSPTCRAGWLAGREPFMAPKEAWEDTTAEEEIDSHTGRVNPQELS
jgi:hypothetical protein